jgi:hypothetical protein
MGSLSRSTPFSFQPLGRAWENAPGARRLQVAFQIVEFTLDANDKVIERKVVPYPYQTRQEALTAIECVMSTFAEAGYELAQKFRWATAGNGDRMRFMIEKI